MTFRGAGHTSGAGPTSGAGRGGAGPGERRESQRWRKEEGQGSEWTWAKAGGKEVNGRTGGDEAERSDGEKEAVRSVKVEIG